MGMATGPRATSERATTSTSKRFQPSDTKGLCSARATFGRCALTKALVCMDSKVQKVDTRKEDRSTRTTHESTETFSFVCNVL